MKKGRQDRIAETLTYGGEGTYNFAVRIYNPTLNKYFVTKPYQLKVWREGTEGEYKWFRSISLVNN